MMFPIIFLFLALSAVLLIRGFMRRSRAMILLLNALLWLLSFVSGFFTCRAWLERSYSENWAMYGFFFISVPIIITTALLVAAAIVLARIRKIENMYRIELSFYLLLAFLAAQAVIGSLSG